MGPTIIIIGAARSGTKLLRSLIARHPALSAVPYDINYIWRIGNEGSPHDELPPNSLTDRARRRIRDYIRRHRTASGAVVEKTVSNALRVPLVDRVFPNALYVHLIRDGRDVIASSYEQWTKPPDLKYLVKKALRFPLLEAPQYALEYATGLLHGRTSDSAARPAWGPRYQGIQDDLASGSILEVCALQWVRSVERARSAFDGLPAHRVLTIRYEMLVHDPRRELIRVADHLSIDSAPYTVGSYDGLDPSYAGCYRDRLESEQLLAVERTAGPELQRLGYVRPPRSNIAVP